MVVQALSRDGPVLFLQELCLCLPALLVPDLQRLFGRDDLPVLVPSMLLFLRFFPSFN